MNLKKIRRPLTLLLTVVSGACMLSFTRQIRLVNFQKPIKHARHPEMVLRWNAAAMEGVRRKGQMAGSPVNVMMESYIYIQVNVAMHDALNSIRPEYKTYAPAIRPGKEADADAAVASAAYSMAIKLMPGQKPYFDSLYAASLNSIKDGRHKEEGLMQGRVAAQAVLKMREDDGAARAQVPYIQGILPGQYRSTPPFDQGPKKGFAGVPRWGMVKPFVLDSASQFRPVPPYQIKSTDYTRDFNEVKTLGAQTGSTRTAEQTELGKFFIENVPSSWNGIARTLILSQNLDAWQAARLLGLLHLAIADANIAAVEAKYHYAFWRPVTAIRMGELDGNPDTKGDSTWNVLVPPTPPVPDYPSNHSVNGAAGSAIFKNFFHGDALGFDATSRTLPGISRHYTDFSSLAHDNAASRVVAGFHFRNATVKGEIQGTAIGNFVYAHALEPIDR